MQEVDELERYLKALAHPVRRTVIKALAQKGSMSYTELMKISGVSDSGTFAFHLRMLGDLVAKNDSGEYELTEKGWRAYRALKSLEDTGEAEETKESPPRQTQKTIDISDRVSFELNEKLASRLAREGARLHIHDIFYVKINEMPEELLEKVIDGIHDVFMVSVPPDLRHIVELRSHDVAFIGDGGLGVMAGISQIIAESVAKTLRLVPRFIDKGFLREGGKKRVPREFVIETLPRDPVAYINIDASDIRITENAVLEFHGKGGEDSIASASVDDNNLRVILDSVYGEIRVPRTINKVHMNIDASNIVGELTYRDGLYITGDACSIKLTARGRGGADIKLDACSGRITLYYPVLSENTVLNIYADTSSLLAEIHIPRGSGVKVSRSGSFISISLDGAKMSGYVEPEPGAGSIEIKTEASASNIRILVIRDL